jgi:hypothetical protein
VVTGTAVPGIFVPWLWIGLLMASLLSARPEVFINEILFNPPYGDPTNEFVELRGPPNLVLPAGTYLVSVEGDTEANPGLIQNRFDLSGQRLGQNGFLVLLQKFHRYRPHYLSTVVTNSDGDGGWGTGASSTVGHTGEGGQIEIENASCSFLLLQAATAPAIGDDVDIDNDGVLDGPAATWTILDSVGILDRDGEGDVAYGKINFHRDTLPGSGPDTLDSVVPTPFTAGYVGRNGNTTDWNETNWVASDNLRGRPPNWFLGPKSRVATNTVPIKRAKAALNHIGAPNFKAPVIPSVIVKQSKSNTEVREGFRKDSYLLRLSLRSTGAVTVRIEAELPAEISTDGGRTYGSVSTVLLLGTRAKKVLVRAVDDGAAGPPQSTVQITHSVVESLDARYPTDLLILPLPVTILDTSVVVLSEAKVNPPGTGDTPYEFIEITGPPGRMLTNFHLVAVQGNSSGNPGRADVVVNLAGYSIGTNGLLVIAATGHPYTFAAGTTVVLAPQLAGGDGALDNGSLSLLLVGTRSTITEGTDLDSRDNGTLDGLPADAFIADAVGWTDRGDNDELYGGVDLTQAGFTPDAASRFPGNVAPRSADAWFVGDLAGTSGGSLDYASVNVSSNSPPGSILTPGVIYKDPPLITPARLSAISGVIGNAENETVTFSISDDDTPLNLLQLTATSTNQSVVPDQNISLTEIAPGKWRLSVEPTGVGYSEIVVRVTDGFETRNGFIRYGASAPGRTNTQWHTSVSDASTAMPIDDEWMFVGDDERQVIRIYSRTRSGGPVAEKDINSLLDVVDFYDDGTPREVDIEASTRVGNRIYWLGSHSHAFNATERTNRARLFATDVSGKGTNSQLKVLAHYDFLKLDLVEWDVEGRHGKGANYYDFIGSVSEGRDPKDVNGGGFNLEGLSMAPGPNNKTNAYIAFRAPLVPPTGPTARSKALIIPVLNFGKLATRRSGPGSAQFGAPIELNLGGRAIRSIEGIGGTNYLIIAGPPGVGTNLPAPGNFKLFTWTGQPSDAPIEHDADLSGLNAEGIVELFPGVWDASTQFQIISDNGTNRYYGDDLEAKFLEENGWPREFKKFRLDTIALGNPVEPAPVIRAAAVSDTTLTVSWYSNEGTTYRVQARPDLITDWTDVPGDVIATDAVASKSIPCNGDRQCFYRILAVSASP